MVCNKLPTSACTRKRRVGNLLPTICSSFTDSGLYGSGAVGNELPTLRYVIGVMMELRNRQKKSLSEMLFDGHNGGRKSTRPEK